MAVKTDLALLEELDAAITEVMTSQELKAGGASGTIVRANLKELRDYREQVYARYLVAQGTGGPTRNVGVIRRT